jgi:hypothetical protein
MSVRNALASVLVLSVWLGCAAPADAHRLDEYLQATRLSIDVEQVRVEIDLTPGASVAPRVFALIDTDQDGQISRAEGDTYARDVLRAVALSVDDTPIATALEDSQFPQFQDMTLGEGMIRVRATALLPSVGAGHHHVSYANHYSPVPSVYLVNAAEQENSRIQIGQPRRDTAQRSFTLEYTVAPDARLERFGWLLAAVALVGLLIYARH